MSFTNEEIKARVSSEVEGGLSDGTLVTPDVYDKNDGMSSDGGELNTPSSLMLNLQEVFTLDLGLSDEREGEIYSLIEASMVEFMPNGWSVYL